MIRKCEMYLSVDIETSGPSVIQNGILAIGICLADIVGNTLFKKRIDVQLDSIHSFDPVCVENFWLKPGPQKVLKVIQANPIPAEDAIKSFIDFVDECDSKYRLEIISDNPTFDFYFLNFYLDKYLQRKPLNYKFGHIYRTLTDSTSFLRGCFGPKYRNMIVKFPGIKHDHFPENDAEYILMCYIQSKKCST
jgi:hypothetical protein